MKKTIIYYIACLLIFAWGCSSNKTDDHSGHDHETHEGHNHEDGDGDCDHNHESDNEESHADEIIFSSEQAKAVNLEWETVKAGEFYQVIKASGQILSAQGDEVTVSATTSGIISFNKSSLNEGSAVKAGEPLLSISSKNLVDGDPIAKARANYDMAKRELDRAESLIADKLISEKEYNAIKLNYENAKIAIGSLAKTQTSRGTSVSSSISGFVKTKLVNEGQYVEVGQILMTITQNRKLQLRADVSERYYKDLPNVTSANFKTPYDKTIHRLADLNGRVTSYARSVSSQEYYLPVNFEFDNIGQVVSGSFVEVYLLSTLRSGVISIPTTALTEEQGIYFVYIQLDEEGYQKQEVKLGASDGARVEILSGLKVGDVVVSKGATYVKLASASSSIPHAHEH